MVKYFSFLLLLLALCRATPARAEHPYVLYAQFVEDTTVELSDGSQWSMDAGDCFPVYMFKEQQTKIVLQLGSATFMTDTKRMRVMKDGEAGKAVVSYRKNLESYLKSRSEKWKDQAK